jgi:hypothetical protein
MSGNISDREPGDRQGTCPPNVKLIAVVSEDRAHFDKMQDTPVRVTFQWFHGKEPDFLGSVTDKKFDAVVVFSSSRALVSARRVCDQIRAQTNTPILFVNTGDYPENTDFSQFCDVDSDYPKTSNGWVLLSHEVIRLVYDIPDDSESLSSRGSKRWRLVVVLVTITTSVSGVTLGVMTGDVGMAAQAAAATFSALLVATGLWGWTGRSNSRPPDPRHLSR